MAVTVSKARKILGGEYRSMSDRDVQDLLAQFYSLAEIISSVVGSKGSNKQLGVIDSPPKNTQYEK